MFEATQSCTTATITLNQGLEKALGKFHMAGACCHSIRRVTNNRGVKIVWQEEIKEMEDIKKKVSDWTQCEGQMDGWSLWASVSLPSSSPISLPYATHYPLPPFLHRTSNIKKNILISTGKMFQFLSLSFINFLSAFKWQKHAHQHTLPRVWIRFNLIQTHNPLYWQLIFSILLYPPVWVIWKFNFWPLAVLRPLFLAEEEMCPA